MLKNIVDVVFLFAYNPMEHILEALLITLLVCVLKNAHKTQITFLIIQLADVFYIVLIILLPLLITQHEGV